jgi:hypothetical protein
MRRLRQACHARRAASTISTAEPFRAQVEQWVAQDVGGIAIHAALKREHDRGHRPSAIGLKEST